MPALTEEAIIEDAKKKTANGATQYKIVALGCTIRDDEYEVCIRVIPRLLREVGLKTICLSFGVLGEERIKDLVDRFGSTDIMINHNLEVGSEGAYRRLIGDSGLSWTAKYNTVSYAREHGLRVCCGGLVGIGETLEDQVDLILALRVLEVTSAAFNVFVTNDSNRSIVAERIRNSEIVRPTDEHLMRVLSLWRLGLPITSIGVNSGYGMTRKGDFGIYSGLVELGLINDKVSLPDQGILSQRRYEVGRI